MSITDLPLETSVSESSDAPATRWRGRGGFLSRWHVLEAAMRCFAAEGYEGVTIRAIAARLGCSVGSIYRYFPDKQSLLRACGGEAMRPAVETAEDPRLSIDEAVQHYVAQATARPELYRLMIWLGDVDGGPPDSVRRVIDGWASKVGDRALAERRWATVHGFLCLGLAARATSLAADRESIGGIDSNASTSAGVVDSSETAAEAPRGRRSAEVEDVTLL